MYAYAYLFLTNSAVCSFIETHTGTSSPSYLFWHPIVKELAHKKRLFRSTDPTEKVYHHIPIEE